MSRSLRLSEQELAGLVKTGKGARAAKPSAPAGKQRIQALGRMKPGQMNKTEARYAQLLDQRKLAGEVLWYAFEAVKLKLADNTHLTVDFFVLLSNGELQAHDVKGAKAMVEDDAKAKMKVAADKFPWPFFMCYPRGRTGYDWDVVEV
ncbi:DUF1064 domain-containing protein [Stutzerimonas nitrititolerans]|uniref:DUF1064 domain-containing protein n=1 Tax=Stutzerimonas nitrititolerans TaxID=2482751 RepID=UPI0028B137C0|nr:DUF1064 domain-containing protein [Stutzerimonas nitrititolerans]